MSIASNIAALRTKPERMREANAQAQSYKDETPYAETWEFLDRSSLVYDWSDGQWTASEPSQYRVGQRVTAVCEGVLFKAMVLSFDGRHNGEEYYSLIDADKTISSCYLGRYMQPITNDGSK